MSKEVVLVICQHLAESCVDLQKGFKRAVGEDHFLLEEFVEILESSISLFLRIDSILRASLADLRFMAAAGACKGAAEAASSFLVSVRIALSLDAQSLKALKLLAMDTSLKCCAALATVIAVSWHLALP